MKRTLLVVVLVCFALATMASAVVAENPPSWRGQNNTARLNWDSQNGLTFIHVGTGLYNLNPYVYQGTNYLTAALPNFYLTNNPVKLMRIQIWWDFGGTKPTFDVVNGIYGAPGNETFHAFSLVGEMDDPVYSLTDWLIQPNPYWEQISLVKTSGTNISRIVIDTWCVPEPSSIIALVGGLGSLLAFRRRRA